MIHVQCLSHSIRGKVSTYKTSKELDKKKNYQPVLITYHSAAIYWQ